MAHVSTTDDRTRDIRGGWACAFPGCGDDNGGGQVVGESIAAGETRGNGPVMDGSVLDVPAAGLSHPPGADDPRSIEALVCEYAWDCETAIAVFWCESRLEAGAISKDGRNVGIAQLNQPTWAAYFGAERWAHVLEPAANLAMAYEIYQLAGGWSPWGCKP